jgi:hypothetical protein
MVKITMMHERCGSKAVQFVFKNNRAETKLANQACKKPSLQKGRCAMARSDFTRPDLGNMPRGNPCAQCGKPIAAPDWIEAGPHCASYLWHCRACDYTFEAVAFFDDKQREPLAA